MSETPTPPDPITAARAWLASGRDVAQQLEREVATLIERRNALDAEINEKRALLRAIGAVTGVTAPKRTSPPAPSSEGVAAPTRKLGFRSGSLPSRIIGYLESHLTSGATQEELVRLLASERGASDTTARTAINRVREAGCIELVPVDDRLVYRLVGVPLATAPPQNGSVAAPTPPTPAPTPPGAPQAPPKAPSGTIRRPAGAQRTKDDPSRSQWIAIELLARGAGASKAAAASTLSLESCEILEDIVQRGCRKLLKEDPDAIDPPRPVARARARFCEANGGGRTVAMIAGEAQRALTIEAFARKVYAAGEDDGEGETEEV